MTKRTPLILIIISILIFHGNAFCGKKITVLEEIQKPERFVFGNGYLYILEGTTIHIYGDKDFKYVGKFGKAGEGPKEIKKNPFGGPITIQPYKGKVYVSSMGKVSVFSKEGKYIKETRIDQFDIFIPFGKAFVGISNVPMKEDQSKRVLAVFNADQNFKKGDILYVSDFEVGQNFKWKFPINAFYPVPYDDKLFIIAGKHGFAIDIFDTKGNKINRIFKKMKTPKVPDEYKKKTIQWFKTSPNYKNFWNFMKTRVGFKSHFPPIYAMFVGTNSLFVLTSVTKGDQRECIVMDYNGNEKRRMMLFAPEIYGMDYNFFANVHENYYYWIIENDDDETWELYKEKIE